MIIFLQPMLINIFFKSINNIPKTLIKILTNQTLNFQIKPYTLQFTYQKGREKKIQSLKSTFQIKTKKSKAPNVIPFSLH